MSRTDQPSDKLSTVVSVLNQVRESMLDQMADQVLSMADDFAEGGFQVNEFLELHGSRLHFLCLLISQFEMLRENRISESKAKERAASTRSKRRDEPMAKPRAEESPSTGGGGEGGADC